MKGKHFFAGILVFILVFGMTVVGCNNSSNSSLKTYEYESRDYLGNIYILTITENSNRAAYSAKVGDNFELKIIFVSGETKTSSGIIQSVISGTLVLKPFAATATFEVYVSGGDISGISGTIVLDSNESLPAPEGDLYSVPTPSAIYMKANFWEEESAPRSNWDSGGILIDIYFEQLLKSEAKYRFTITGTSNTEMVKVGLHVFAPYDKDWNWIYISDNSSLGEFKHIPAGNFSLEIELKMEDFGNLAQVPILPNAFFSLWNDESPAQDVPSGTVMATITNLNITITEITD